MEGVIRRDFREAAERTHDLVIVGGGAYGITLTLEAARRGLDAVLVERGDFGGETSFNSLRIVHGGIRYLQSMDLPRFFESVRERTWLLQRFPDRVHPLPCLMPLYGTGARRPSVFRIALALNDLLAGRALPRGRVLGPDETLQRFPAAAGHGLSGGALWWDAVMPDSERLLVEMLRWASSCGAIALSYAPGRELIREGGRAAGVRVEDLATGTAHEIRARAVVNCAGPWCREVAERFDRDDPSLFRPSLAMNLVLNREPPADCALAVTAPEKGSRTYFLHPWKGRIFAGTFHAPWSGGTFPDGAPEDAVRTLLGELNAALPSLSIRREDVLRVRWGLLPVAREGTTDLLDRPLILDHGSRGGPQGLFSVSGVKFTTARGVAEKTLRRVVGGALPAPGRTPRPEPRVLPSASDFRALLAGDREGAARIVREIARTESVVHIEDLLLRRTDWGLDPCDEQELTGSLRDVLQDHPEGTAA